MAIQLGNRLKVAGGYLDEAVSVENLSGLLSREPEFYGQSIHMTDAFYGNGETPYPIDFWLVPDSIMEYKWEMKIVPALESEEDFEGFKSFISEFKQETGYFPLANGAEVLVNGIKYNVNLVEDEIEWVDNQTIFDETIADAVEIAVSEAVEKVTSGASEAFDTLKEIEDWIKNNPGGSITPDTSNLATKEELAAVEAKIPSIEGLATKEEVSALESLIPEIGHLATSADVVSAVEEIKSTIPSVEGLASEKWVEEQGFLKEHQDLSEYAKKTDIPSIEGLASTEWVENQGFLKEHQDISHLAASADVVSAIEEVKNVIPSVDGLATETFVEEKISEIEIPSIEGLATETFVKNAIADAKLSGNTEIDLTGYATKDDIKDLAHKDDIKSYTEGASISIDESNKISVKIAKDTEEKENFIEVNEDNELVLNAITLDATVISEDIEVNGGAWADEVETVFDGKIPAGITFEDFLKKMLKKEKFVSDFTTAREFTVTVPEINPGIIVADKDVNGQIVEVGTKITIGAINPTTTKATQYLSAGTFTYGYKVGEKGELIKSQVYTEKLKPVLVKSASTIQVNFTNLTQDIEGTMPLTTIFMSKENDGNEISIEPITAYVHKNYNSVTISYTGDTYATNTDVKGNAIYAATSLGNFYTRENENMLNVYTVDFPESEATATTQTKYQITGACKYYIGDIVDYSNNYWDANRSQVILGFAEQGWATGSTIEVPYTFKEGTKQQTVAVPAEYTKVFGRDRLSGPVEFQLVREKMKFHNSQGYISEYNIFVAPSIDGLVADSYIYITIS